MPARSTPAYRRATERLALQVRDRRTKQGWTQEDLAERSEISRNQIQNIEANRNNTLGPDGRPGLANPNLATLYALADALNCSISDLLEVGDEEHHAPRGSLG